MACGLPVVSFDCPWGPQAIINDGEDGLLVENGNVNKLADAICFLINNKDIREQIGRKGIVNARRFNMEHVTLQWKQLFEFLHVGIC